MIGPCPGMTGHSRPDMSTVLNKGSEPKKKNSEGATCCWLAAGPGGPGLVSFHHSPDLRPLSQSGKCSVRFHVEPHWPNRTDSVRGGGIGFLVPAAHVALVTPCARVFRAIRCF